MMILILKYYANITSAKLIILWTISRALLIMYLAFWVKSTDMLLDLYIEMWYIPKFMNRIGMED